MDQYDALPDEEKAHLWNKWADLDLMDLEEREVAPDALPVGQSNHLPSPMRDEERGVWLLCYALD